MSDPNQPYVPQEYPKALYRDHGTMRIAVDADEESALSDDGFVPFADLPERPADDLELLTHDQLVEVLVVQLRKLTQSRTRDELLQLARVQRDAEVANAAIAERQAAEQAAINEAVMALGGEDGEEPDHLLYGHSQLPDTVTVGGIERPIGEVVGEAFAASDLTDDEWNDLQTASRDAKIEDWLIAAGWTPPEAAQADEQDEPALALATDAPTEEVADPLDHDADGKKGGAPDVSGAVLKLRADLDALGVKYDGRWREERLTQALDEATKA